METLKILTASEQVASYLRRELYRGVWSDLMPGSNLLARQLGVGGNTLEAALALLEQEGLLASQGPRRRRTISLPENTISPVLRIAIFHYDHQAKLERYLIDIQHELESSGHSVSHAPKTLVGLGMNVDRVAGVAAKSNADAWIVVGASQNILSWFVHQKIPAFALFGRRRQVQIAGAGPDKIPAYTSVARALYHAGHRRIVLLTSKMRRLPTPGLPELAFIEELRSLGLTIGSYNLPDWEETPEGLEKLLDSLFSLTPPTALLIDETLHFLAAQHYLTCHGIIAPEKISLICMDSDPSFSWIRPKISHVRWESRPLVRRIARWADNIARGETDLRQSFTKAEFITGGTIGRCPAAPPHPY